MFATRTGKAISQRDLLRTLYRAQQRARDLDRQPTFPCWWEDDGVQSRDPDYAGEANKPSLREARENFRLFRSSDRAPSVG